MPNLYTPDQLGIKAPTGGFKTGGWYNGRQYWNGTLSDAGVIHPQSNQQGAGVAVSAPVNAQSAAQQGVTPQQFNNYLATEQKRTDTVRPTSTVNVPTPINQPGWAAGNTAGNVNASAGNVALPQVTPQAALNLPDLYNSLYQSSGISAKEEELKKLEQEYLTQKAKISDNPFLDASTVDKRLSRLNQIYEANTAPLKNEVTLKKADIETQLNLQTKQFDINSAQAQTAMNQFKMLLETGSLTSANADSIASIARSTGLSTDMINSAIASAKSKNVETQIISYDDGSSQGYALVDKNTGEVIKQQAISRSKPREGTATERQADERTQTVELAKSDARNGVTLTQMFAAYSGFLTADEIYQIYNANSIYGPAKEDQNTLTKYGVKNPAY